MKQNINNIKYKEKLKRNELSDKGYKITLMLITSFLIFVILCIFLGMIVRGIVIANKNGVGILEALFGESFVPGIGGVVEGRYGVLFIVFNTIWMSMLALLISVPLSVSTAIFITRVLPKKMAFVFFAVVAILAAIPSVIYGAFAQHTLDSFMVKRLGAEVGSLMTVIFMVAFMIMPTITIMSITSINNVDRKMEDSSLALGATKIQTSLLVTLRAAKSGIILGATFGLGRALGEATAISMVYTPNSTGLTLSPWNTSLFLSPLIMSLTSGSNDMGVYEFEIFAFLTAVMLITVIVLFIIMKLIDTSTDAEQISKKQSKKILEMNNVFKKVENEGFASLTQKENNIYVNGLITHDARKRQEEFYSSELVMNRSSLQKTSLESNVKYEEYKRRTSIKSFFVVSIFSLVGVALLAMIMKFVFLQGFTYDGYNFLTWDFISGKGVVDIVEAKPVYGLSIPIMGTFINVLITLSLALPVGIIMGLYFGLYLDRHSIIGKIISVSVQIMTSIPAVVYGAIATIIFAKTSITDNFIMFEPMFMMAIIVLPTIIKQTEDGVKSVKISQIEGSLGLGATKFQTTGRLYLKQIFPSILTATLLAISIIMAESAIFLTMFGTMSGDVDNIAEWLQSGGSTLTITIYKLAMTPGPFAFTQMKAAAAVMILFVLTITSISQLVRLNKFMPALYVFVSMVICVLSIQIGNDIGFVIFIIGILFGFAMCVMDLVLKGKRN